MHDRVRKGYRKKRFMLRGPREMQEVAWGYIGVEPPSPPPLAACVELACFCFSNGGGVYCRVLILCAYVLDGCPRSILSRCTRRITHHLRYIRRSIVGEDIYVYCMPSPGGYQSGATLDVDGENKDVVLTRTLFSAQPLLLAPGSRCSAAVLKWPCVCGCPLLHTCLLQG